MKRAYWASFLFRPESLKKRFEIKHGSNGGEAQSGTSVEHAGFVLFSTARSWFCPLACVPSLPALPGCVNAALADILHFSLSPSTLLTRTVRLILRLLCTPETFYTSTVPYTYFDCSSRYLFSSWFCRSFLPCLPLGLHSWKSYTLTTSLLATKPSSWKSYTLTTPLLATQPPSWS